MASLTKDSAGSEPRSNLRAPVPKCICPHFINMARINSTHTAVLACIFRSPPSSACRRSPCLCTSTPTPLKKDHPPHHHHHYATGSPGQRSHADMHFAPHQATDRIGNVNGRQDGAAADQQHRQPVYLQLGGFAPHCCHCGGHDSQQQQ